VSLLKYRTLDDVTLSDFDSIVESGASMFAASASASFRQRGVLGARTTIVGTDPAYGVVNLAHALGPGQSIALGLRYCQRAAPSTNAMIAVFRGTGPVPIYVRYNGAYTEIRGWSTGAGFLSDALVVPSNDAWHYIAIVYTRATSVLASDGIARGWVDRTLVGEITGINNYVLAETISHLEMGGVSSVSDGFRGDIDEIKVGTDIPAVMPYRPYQQGPAFSAVQPSTVTGVIGAHRLLRK